MARYPLNLPVQLKQEAEAWASKQGVSLNQFILWSVAEKVGSLNQQLDDPAFTQITYRRGAAGYPVPVLRISGIRVQTVLIAHKQWNLSIREVATEYGITETEVKEALAFYQAHKTEIDSLIAADSALETANG